MPKNKWSAAIGNGKSTRVSGPNVAPNSLVKISDVGFQPAKAATYYLCRGHSITKVDGTPLAIINRHLDGTFALAEDRRPRPPRLIVNNGAVFLASSGIVLNPAEALLVHQHGQKIWNLDGRQLGVVMTEYGRRFCYEESETDPHSTADLDRFLLAYRVDGTPFAVYYPKQAQEVLSGTGRTGHRSG